MTDLIRTRAEFIGGLTCEDFAELAEIFGPTKEIRPPMAYLKADREFVQQVMRGKFNKTPETHPGEFHNPRDRFCQCNDCMKAPGRRQ